LAAALFPVLLTVLAGGLLVASMVRFSPGFGMDEEQMDPRLSRESVQALREARAEERNPVRFCLAWMARVAAGDAVLSTSLGRPVGELLAERAPATLRLMGWGLLAAWCAAAALAWPAAAWRLPGLDGVCTALNVLVACVPAAGMAILLFHFGGPAVCMMAAVLLPKLYQYLRSLFRQGYSRPHVLLARAKGLGHWSIFTGHVLRPAAPQFLALAAVSVNMGFGASVAVEAVCDLPGLGQLAWKAALARDLPLLVALTVMVTLLTRISSLAADLCAAPQRSAA
jgi:peptide/nickel transport system permease protein